MIQSILIISHPREVPSIHEQITPIQNKADDIKDLLNEN